MTLKASDWHFANTRALFDAARDAARECEKCRIQVEKLESSEGVKAQSYDATGHGSSPSDPMRPTDRRIEFERRKHDIIEDDEALMDYAFDVLYGADRESGASSLLASSLLTSCGGTGSETSRGRRRRTCSMRPRAGACRSQRGSSARWTRRVAAPMVSSR